MVKNLSNLIFESVKGKYFQYILNPRIIIQNLDSVEPRAMGKSESTFSSYSPILNDFVEIPLDQIHLYLEISEEQFNKIKGMHEKGLGKEIQKEFNKSLLYNNKPNLSAQETNVSNLNNIHLGLNESYSEFGLPKDDRDNDPIY